MKRKLSITENNWWSWLLNGKFEALKRFNTVHYLFAFMLIRLIGWWLIWVYSSININPKNKRIKSKIYVKNYRTSI